MDIELLGIILGSVLPLYLMLFVIYQKIGTYDEIVEEVRTNGEELERVIVQKTRSHFSNVRVRTRLIHCKLMGKRTGVRREYTNPAADGGEAA